MTFPISAESLRIATVEKFTLNFWTFKFFLCFSIFTILGYLSQS
jgi:hypothetical protein